MPELSAPADWITQRSQRIESITRTVAALNHQQAQLRLELNALAQESAGYRTFTGSELALHLAESPQTVDSWITNAEIFCEHPTVVAHVAAGHWTLRHADALINELIGSTLTPAQRDQVATMVTSRDSARTPYEIRRATRAAVLILDPDAARARYDKTNNNRTVATFDTTDGATLLASGTKSQIAAMMAGLDALCLIRQPDDPRNLPQRRFDTLMDLICGRLQPGQWTAYVMVDLTVLHDLLNPDPTDSPDSPDSPDSVAGTGMGTDAGAGMGTGVGGEIPGLGLITRTEAAELLGHATIRRAVVDEHGQLISLDSTTLTPDTTPTTPTPTAAAAGRLRTRDDVLEPTTPLERDLETQTLHEQATAEGHGAPTTADRHWLHAQRENDAHLAAALDTEVWALTSRLEADLTALLTQPQYAFTGSHHPAPTRTSGITVQISRPHGGDNGHGWGRPPGGSPDDQPDDPADRYDPDSPEHDPDQQPAHPDTPPPTITDSDWHQQQLPAPDTSHTPEPPWTYITRRPPRTAPPTPKATPSWTLPGLRRALTKLLTTPVDPKPLDSTAYALPPRLARHVKARDLTCTFPGCHRQAQTCQNDHVIAWPLGPSTTHNIRSECTHHHQAKHHCFTVTAQPNGGLTWTTVTGHSTTRYPRPFLRGW